MADAVVFQITGAECNCTSVTNNIHRFLSNHKIIFMHCFGKGVLPIQYILFVIPDDIDKKQLRKNLDEFEKTNKCAYDIFFFPYSTSQKIPSVFKKNKRMAEQSLQMVGKDTLIEILQRLVRVQKRKDDY